MTGGRLEPTLLVDFVKQTLADQNVPYDQIINEFGQVQASNERTNGKLFLLRDHVRGVVLAMLSNQRRWAPIANNLNRIEEIFGRYDPVFLSESNPESLVQSLSEIRCGNRQIKFQMQALKQNIITLKRIEKEYGSLDAFVTSSDPFLVAESLAKPGCWSKILELGPALACEYLKNVGVRASKPDVHIRRLLSGKRLGLSQSENVTEREAYRLIDKLAEDAKINPVYLDNLLWLFCAIDYGNICGAHPRCDVCRLNSYCNYSPHASERAV